MGIKYTVTGFAIAVGFGTLALLSVPSHAGAAATGAAFNIEAGAVRGTFSELNGVGSENEVIEQKLTTGGRDIVKLIPGRLKFTEIKLKRTMTPDMTWADWRQQVVDGQIATARRNATIVMYDAAMKPAVKWELTNAWPKAVIESQQPGGIVTEELTLAAETVKRVKL